MITHAQRVRMFGSFKFKWEPRPGNPEHVMIDPVWTQISLVQINIPEIGRPAWVHYLVKGAFLDLWEAWRKEGLLEHVHTFDGAFASRFKRQNGTEEQRRKKCAVLGAPALSNHAYGSAFDLNARELPLGRPAPAGHVIHELAGIAKAH